MDQDNVLEFKRELSLCFWSGNRIEFISDVQVSKGHNVINKRTYNKYLNKYFNLMELNNFIMPMFYSVLKILCIMTAQTLGFNHITQANREMNNFLLELQYSGGKTLE